MADETVSSFYDVDKVTRERAADVVNIKVGKVGGLHMAKKIAHALEAVGITAQAGSNLEVGIGSAASIHFVASTKNVNLPSDLFIGGYLHEYDLIEGGLIFNNGRVKCPDIPGLGIEVDEKRIFS